MKSVFITGGGRGIGKECVLAFLKAGYQVGFSYHRSIESAKELESIGCKRAVAFFCDLSKQSDVEVLAKTIKEEFGTPDVLVNNAGVAHYGLFQELLPEAFDELFQVNFKSAYYLTARLVPEMIRRGSGRIVNVASVWGEVGGSCEAAYSASKGAMIAFTRALAKELAPSGISVNAVSPGVVETEMMGRFSREEKRAIAEGIPVGRFAEAEEIARTVFYLGDGAPGYLTGQIIGINGGFI